MKNFDEPRDYGVLLGRLKELKFDFLGRDVHGRTLAHMLYYDLHSRLKQHKLLGRMSLLLDNHGYLPGDLLLGAAKDSKQHISPRAGPLRHTISSILQKLSWKSGIMAHNEKRLEYASDIDVCGDTPLTAVLKQWKKSDESEETLRAKVTLLISVGAVIDMRDREGYTASAILTIRGFRLYVDALLTIGATPNSRNYDGKSTVL